MSGDHPFEVAPCPNCGLPIWPYGLTCGYCGDIRWVLMLRYRDPGGNVQAAPVSQVQFFVIAFDGEEPSYIIGPPEESNGFPWTPIPAEDARDRIVIGFTDDSRPGRYRWPYKDREITRLGYFYRHRWSGEEIGRDDFPAHQPGAGVRRAQSSVESATRERGSLDERAAVLAAKNPGYSISQVSQILGCNASTLRDKRRYPIYAAARARIKATRLDLHQGDRWHDRRGEALG